MVDLKLDVKICELCTPPCQLGANSGVRWREFFRIYTREVALDRLNKGRFAALVKIVVDGIYPGKVRPESCGTGKVIRRVNAETATRRQGIHQMIERRLALIGEIMGLREIHCWNATVAPMGRSYLSASIAPMGRSYRSASIAPMGRSYHFALIAPMGRSYHSASIAPTGRSYRSASIAPMGRSYFAL